MVIKIVLSAILWAGIYGCKARAPMPGGVFISPLTELKRFNHSHLYFNVTEENLNQLKDVRVLQIEPVQLLIENEEDNILSPYSLIRQYKVFFEERLYYNLVSQLSPQVIICASTSSLQDYEQLNYPIVRLRIGVIKFNPGLGWLRYLMGFVGNLGAGGVNMYVEGSLISASDNSGLAGFLVKMQYSGNQFWGPNPKVISHHHCLREGLDLIAEEIAKFCKFILFPTSSS
ncbi:MAG: hypothetical protein N2246_02710 [Candidatus Sumerlaeia bacterium]|nr:hypothetical protein [Candidatus Sumerlaeia bacterium]